MLHFNQHLFRLERVTLAILLTGRASTVCYLAPTLNSREQATQSITRLVDFSQFIPKIILYYKFCIM